MALILFIILIGIVIEIYFVKLTIDLIEELNWGGDGLWYPALVMALISIFFGAFLIAEIVFLIAEIVVDILPI